MRKLHLWAGVLTVLVFTGTGQFMRHHHPPMVTLSESARLMFRSRHIYLLASGLVNLMLGLYMQRDAGWRAIVQLTGSVFVLGSPVLLMLAFVNEPENGFQLEMWRSAFGLYSLFLGCVLHAATAMGSERRKR